MMIDNVLKYLIYLFFLLVPLMSWKIKFHGIPLAADFIIASLIMVTYLLSLLLGRDISQRVEAWKRRLFTGSLWKIIIIYILIAALSFIKSVNLGASISELLRFLSYIMLLWIIITEVKNKATILNILKCFTLSTFIAAVFGIIQAFTGIGLYSAYNSPYAFGVSRRIASTMFNPNNYAAFLILVSFVFLLLGFYGGKRLKIIMTVLFVLLSLNLVLTFTRGAWLGFLASAAILSFAYNKKLLYFLSIPAVLIVFVNSVRNRFLSIFSLSSGANITRLKLWKTGLLMIRDNPILGVGMGNSIYVYDGYIKKYPQLALNYPKYPLHDSFIKVAAETGFLGLIAFILMIGYVVYSVYRINKMTHEPLLKGLSTGFLFSITGFLIMNFTDDCFFIPQVTVFFWLIFGVVLAYYYSEQESLKKPYKTF